MRSSLRLFFFIILLSLLAATAIELTITSPAQSVPPSQRAANKSADYTKLEEAYRANNIGVGLLEQYKTNDAIQSFERALQIDPNLKLAQTNLVVALYYLPDTESAIREARKGLAQDQGSPQLHYLLGLIARAQSRFDDAITEFQQVLKTDVTDVGTQVNIGQVFVQQRKHKEAIAAFRAALEREPYNLTALYNLGLLLTRTGEKEEAQRLLQKFRQLQQSGAGTSLGTNYLEGGRYAEAIVSTGAEADLVDPARPNVEFIDASENPFGATRRGKRTGSRSRSDSALLNADAIVLFDYDSDGDLDIFDTSYSQRLLQNDQGRFTDVTAGSGLSRTGSQHCFAAVAGDYDNDGRSDLLVVLFPGNTFVLYHNDGNGHFSDRTKQSGIETPSPTGAAYVSAAFVDVDHDGDLDIFIAGLTTILFRNNGNGTFTDITQAAKVTLPTSSIASQIVPTDFDNRRDVDLFLLSRTGPPILFRNMRDGTFLDVAKEIGLDGHGFFRCVAAGDINKDGFTDFFVGGERRGAFFLSDGRGHFRFSPAPVETNAALAAQFLDYDNDGLLDLLVATSEGLKVWRNVGSQFVDVSDQAMPAEFRNLSAIGVNKSQTALASGDLDGDGDVDLVLRGKDGNLRLLRNEGGNRNHSLRASLRGRVSNVSAIEAKIEVRAGSLWQRLETYSAWPAPAPADVVFGLGKHERPDALRVLWPAGIVQAETEFPELAATVRSAPLLKITELDRKPSSCPYLYTWNGKRFEFVTDFMGGGEMGYLEEPGRYNNPDSDEYVRIRDDQLKERNGQFEIRLTNELEEALFADRLQLMAIAHPGDTEVYPNEGMTDPPKPFKLFVTHGARTPVTAFDDRGHDVLERISFFDRRYPDDFKLDRIRGYADEHTLTMKLGESKAQLDKSKVQRPKSNVRDSTFYQTSKVRPSYSILSKQTLDVGRWTLDDRRTLVERMVLLLTGWTDYAWSSDNIAATQAGKTSKPPALQVKDQRGNWRTVIENIGIPVGRPQTVTVDLTGKFLSSSREVRIITNMRIYWDQILVDTSSGDAPIQTTAIDPIAATLRWRGFSSEVTPDGREPFGYDYERVTFTSPWKVMTGWYTREGDVLELLTKSDDMFVISRPGDEISVSFDAGSLPPLPTGWKRTFLLYADGFSKEMDINSASPDQVSPLPFHGMTHYPYNWPEHYPLTDERQRYIERYNTRRVTSPIASILELEIRN